MDPAIPARGDLHFYLEIEILDGGAFPGEELILLERAIGGAGEDALFE